MIRRPPSSPLFPYRTLSGSGRATRVGVQESDVLVQAEAQNGTGECSSLTDRAQAAACGGRNQDRGLPPGPSARSGRRGPRASSAGEAATLPRQDLPVPYRREAKRLCTEGEKTPPLSPLTDEAWPKPAA